MKDFLYECFSSWGCLIPMTFFVILAVLYLSDKQAFKQAFVELTMGSCAYSVGEVVSIRIPTEEITVTYGGIKQKKDHCQEYLFIEIADMPYIPKNFIGGLKVEITKIMSLYRYSGKIIHIRPKDQTKG